MLKKSTRRNAMKWISYLLVAATVATGVIANSISASGHADEEAAPIYGVKVPAGYRDWKLIAVAQLLVPGKADQLRAQLGDQGL
jgi:hypothetical protein